MKRLIPALLIGIALLPVNAYAEEPEPMWELETMNDGQNEYISNTEPFLFSIGEDEADEIKTLLPDENTIFALYDSDQFAYIFYSMDGEPNVYEKDFRHDAIIENEAGETIEFSGVQTAGKSLVVCDYTEEINEFLHNSDTAFIKYSYMIFKDQEDPIYRSFEIKELSDLMAMYDVMIAE